MDHYDVVVIGSGFGSLFFLKTYLDNTRGTRVAVVEWGQYRSHAWQIAERRNSTLSSETLHQQRKTEKPWVYTIGLGGGTNCWWGQSIRFLPSDFELHTRYGVFEDWPLRYDDLEPYYCEVERIMQVSGPNSLGRISPRSEPYPLPPHLMSAPDRLMHEAQPDFHFPTATARASVATSTRNRCCATSVCDLCPTDAKFTALNGMRDVLENDRVDILLGAKVTAIDTQGSVAKAVIYEQDQVSKRIEGDLVVLGANAIHSPAILLRSGLDHPGTGRGLCEQLTYGIEVKLDGVDNFNGSTMSTGLNYSLYDGAHRRDVGASLIQTENFPKFGLRTENSRWQQSLPLILHVEELPQERDGVTLTDTGDPMVRYHAHSDYAKAGFEYAMDRLESVLSPLPIEEIVNHGQRPTESHVQCSLRMGHDPETSVIDGLGIHHSVRNLVVVGSAVFTTCPPSNPSLTVAALAARSADQITRSGRSA